MAERSSPSFVAAVAAVYDDIVAVSRQRHSDGFADAAARTGDQDAFHTKESEGSEES